MKLSSRRQRRLGDVLKQEISDILQAKIRDPRVGFVTVTAVDVSPDLQNAKVFVQILGDEAKRKSGLIGLSHAASFIRSDLAGRLTLRQIPELHFLYDESLDNYERIDRILKELPHDRT